MSAALERRSASESGSRASSAAGAGRLERAGASTDRRARSTAAMTEARVRPEPIYLTSYYRGQAGGQPVPGVAGCPEGPGRGAFLHCCACLSTLPRLFSAPRLAPRAARALPRVTHEDRV